MSVERSKWDNCATAVMDDTRKFSVGQVFETGSVCASSRKSYPVAILDEFLDAAQRKHRRSKRKPSEFSVAFPAPSSLKRLRQGTNTPGMKTAETEAQ